MSIFTNVDNISRVYFSIIAGFVVPLVLVFNLAEIGPYSYSKTVQLVSLTSTRTSLEPFHSHNRSEPETYTELLHFWEDAASYKELGFLLAPKSYIKAGTNWSANRGGKDLQSSGGQGFLVPHQFGGSIPLFNSSFLHNTCSLGQFTRQEETKIRGIYCYIVVIIVLLLLVLFFLLRKNKKPNNENDQIAEEGSAEIFESCSPRPFTFQQLSHATNNFHQDRILGVGGFGAVYRAVLPNGRNVAVKRVSSTSQQGIKEYKAEVTIVSRSNHRHLVQLIGWCHEIKGEFLVVYELMENKSLDLYLFNSKMAPLAWDLRYKIAQGLAKALRYLHEECGQHCVLHMDIKSSNVLLDSNFEPKLGDFGLAKLVDHDQSMELSVLAGTRGYLAPECVLTGRVSQQSDVYSFGVVVLELVTGRKTLDTNAQEDQIVLVKWVQNLYRMSRILEAVDPKLGDDYDEQQVKRLMVVGLWCVQHDFHERPSMREIVCILDDTQDQLPNLHFPSLVHDLVSPDFDLILESPRPSDLIASMEMGSPSTEFVDDTVLPKPEDHTYSPLLVWRHMSILYLLRYLVGITWFRSSPNG